MTEPMRAAGLGVHIKNLYNDYVYFWRWAVWQATELPPGPGVVAFITASSYLDGVSMGGVRNLLRAAFDELWIIDLGGEGRGAQTEENVFDIRTPVAIAIGVSMDSEFTEKSADETSPHEHSEGSAGGLDAGSRPVPAGRRRERTPTGECTVRYLRIAGTRADKLAPPGNARAR